MRREDRPADAAFLAGGRRGIVTTGKKGIPAFTSGLRSFDTNRPDKNTAGFPDWRIDVFLMFEPRFVPIVFPYTQLFSPLLTQLISAPRRFPPRRQISRHIFFLLPFSIFSFSF